MADKQVTLLITGNFYSCPPHVGDTLSNEERHRIFDEISAFIADHDYLKDIFSHIDKSKITLAENQYILVDGDYIFDASRIDKLVNSWLVKYFS